MFRSGKRVFGLFSRTVLCIFPISPSVIIFLLALGKDLPLRKLKDVSSVQPVSIIGEGRAR